MNNKHKLSFSKIKKNANNNYNLLKYKTDRNSEEKENLKYYKKGKIKLKINFLSSFATKSNIKTKKKLEKVVFKDLISNKDSLKKIYNVLTKGLRKYNFCEKKYNIQKANEIVFDKNKRLVSIFKDYLLWNETSDFLKQYYKSKESLKILPNMCEYYEGFTLIFPEYGPLEDVLKIIKKNIKKKKFIKKLEDYDEQSILNIKYDNKESINSKKDIKIDKFQKIIDEKDVNMELSKTYSHSKTCLNNTNDNEYRKEKKIDNHKDLPAIFVDFLNSDEKIIDNYNYLSNKNCDFLTENEMKKFDKFYLDNKIKYKQNGMIRNKKKANINKYDNKNNDSDNLGKQKIKLKKIFNMIKTSKNHKKINLKSLTENLTNNKIIKSKNKQQDIEKTKHITNKIYSKNKKDLKLKKNNIKINNIITKKNLIKKDFIKPITLSLNNLNKKIKNKFNKNNNYSISSKESKNLLYFYKSKASKSSSSNASKNKISHRYELLINKIFNVNQKYKDKTKRKYSKIKNYSEGKKFLKNRNINMKSKEKSLNEKNIKKKNINNNNNNLSYNYTCNNNNLLSFKNINRTIPGKINSFHNTNVKSKTINMKMNNRNNNYIINNSKNNSNPFKINNNISRKHSFLEKNQNKNINLNDYIFLSLSNRINSNKKDKIKLNLILNKTNDIDNWNTLEKSKYLGNLKRNKKNKLIMKNHNNANTVNLKSSKKQIKEGKNKLNTLNKNYIKALIDSSITRNEELLKEKGNNTIRLVNAINIENKNLKNLKANINKRGVITSREKKNSKINTIRNKKSKKIFNLNKLEIGKKFEKYNDIKRRFIKDIN